MARSPRPTRTAAVSTRRPALRRRAALICFERLEMRMLLAFDPSPQAQEMLEHVNRMRVNPQAELNVLFSSLQPLTARDADANSAIKYFNDPTAAGIQGEWQSLKAVAPLAWNENLVTAALGHSERMIAADQQSHQLPGEPGLGDRVRNAGYGSWSTVGENVFAYAKNPFHAHSGFAIDWGVSNRGHRLNIMSASFRDFGVGFVEETASATRVGPLVTTQNFASRFNYGNPFLLGVVYRDGNSNQRFDAGEGIGGATLTVTGPAGTFTTTTMSAGGYQLKVPAGTYTVTAAGGGLSGSQVRSGVAVSSANVKVDFSGSGSATNPTNPTNPVAPSAPTGVVATAGNGRVLLAWQPPSTNAAGVTNYTVQFSRTGGASWTTFMRPTSTETTALVTGLTNGADYVFRVAAMNSAGTGAFSTTSAAVRPSSTLPLASAPTAVTTTVGNGRATLRWTAPRSSGSTPITSYKVLASADGGATWTAAEIPASPRTTASVTNLTNGVEYVFRVAAVNAAGTGSFSALSTRVTPMAGAMTTIDLAPFANQRLQSLGSGAVNRFPEGNVKLGGVNFAIPVGGSNAWSAAVGGGTTAGTLDVPIGATGVTKVYTLINTLWGERERGTRASITFHGSKGAVYKVDLDGDSHIRDYLWNTSTNSINGTSTVNVFTAGSRQGTGSTSQVRLDMQTFNLPAEFATQSLTKISIADAGATNVQRVLVSGITVA